jgi:hypothetical protein
VCQRYIDLLAKMETVDIIRSADAPATRSSHTNLHTVTGICTLFSIRDSIRKFCVNATQLYIFIQRSIDTDSWSISFHRGNMCVNDICFDDIGPMPYLS